MIENKLDLDIISLYDRNLKSLYSINQISKRLNKRYPYINKKVNLLIQSNILQKVTLGRSHLCTLNLDNEETVILLSLNEIKKKQGFHFKKREALDQLMRSLKDSVSLYCVIALPSQEKDRVVFVCNLPDEKEEIAKHAGSFGLDVLAYTKRELIAELSSSKNRMFDSHIVLYGYERFFELVNEACQDINQMYSSLRV